MNMSKILLSSDPAERQHYEDQITVNLWARRLLAGNSRVLVVEAADRVTTRGCLLSDVGEDLGKLQEQAAAVGARVLLGSELFTARDNARPFKAAK